MRITQNSKGITPIIAIILLILMTVAAASASFFWLVRIQGELQGGTAQFQEQTFERIASSIQWQDGDYNATQGLLTLSLLNTGTTDVPVENSSTSPKVQWSLLDSDQDVKCATDWATTGYPGAPVSTSSVNCTLGCGTKIEQSELRLIKLNLNSSNCDLSSEPSDSLWFAKISFSGKTTTAGTFERRG